METSAEPSFRFSPAPTALAPMAKLKATPIDQPKGGYAVFRAVDFPVRQQGR